MMTHQPHNRHMTVGSPALLAAAEAALTDQGIAWTHLREQIFAVLSEQETPVSAYDVAERLSHRLDRRIAANSVYRILDLFVEHNLAKRVESRNAYVANTHPACEHDCIFLVCDSCNNIAHLDDDTLAGGLRQRAKSAGFTPVRPVVEVIGRCHDCTGGKDR